MDLEEGGASSSYELSSRASLSWPEGEVAEPLKWECMLGLLLIESDSMFLFEPMLLR